jgi:uncharacterized protein YrrD
MRLDLGSPVNCTDGAFGEIGDVVIEPKSLTVTHLVVEPHHHHGVARLVPIDHVSVDGDGISLAYTLAGVQQLPLVQEFSHLRLGEQLPIDPDWEVGVETVLATPSSSGYGGYGAFGQAHLDYDQAYSITFDRVPKGEIEISRTGHVDASDGQNLGRVAGFLVQTNGALTHLVLRRGHLWGRRVVTIPVGAVSRFATDAITLRLTKTDFGAGGLAPALK